MDAPPKEIGSLLPRDHDPPEDASPDAKERFEKMMATIRIYEQDCSTEESRLLCYIEKLVVSITDPKYPESNNPKWIKVAQSNLDSVMILFQESSSITSQQKIAWKTLLEWMRYFAEQSDNFLDLVEDVNYILDSS